MILDMLEFGAGLFVVLLTLSDIFSTRRLSGARGSPLAGRV